ncbi:hypothetical protein CANARDRAFT_26964 [[Candida] arabinofermentans NRRL YB-2248]|uniref:Anaphase-promoting complex subunit 4 n=1 Tax=[Candida] arabinofermentans NRRL YB-2248 TaxID=983967 RepID=A0A1E4T739_9ASCO|nr:hypothetical protein CANARDRAFT_26964 [[Candida] arabinofermentans NRRL YB-2248]
MDLISFQFNENTIWMYRLNNQKVWTIELGAGEEGQDTEVEIESLCWRPDGKLFSVITSGGTVNLFDSNTGKMALSFKLDKAIECSSWFSRSTEFDFKNKFDHLFDFNLANSLTKLSTSHGSKKLIGDNDLIKCDDSSLDFLIIGSEGGSISIILYGIFTIENFQFKQLENCYSTTLSIQSNKDLTSHYVLIEKEDGLSILKLDTNFARIYGSLLPTVALTCSKLVGLLSYVKELVDKLILDGKPFDDYSTRIIALLKGEIEEKSSENDNTDPKYDLYDLLLTGIMSDPTKTWLTDYLGDRGIKRWIKLGNQYFEGSRKTMFYNLIPALEHLIIHLSTLQGLAKWKENERQLSLNESMLTSSIEIASNLLKLLHRNIVELNESQRGFESFVKWLGSILLEVTTDEQDNEPVRTKEIIQYLSSGLSNSTTQVKDEFSDLYDQLDSQCNDFFNGIKNNMKERMESTLMSNISGIGSIDSNFTLFENLDDGSSSMGLVLICRKINVELVKFDPVTLDYLKFVLTFDRLFQANGPSKIQKIQGSVISETKFILLINYKSDRSGAISSQVIVVDASMVFNSTEFEIEITDQQIIKQMHFAETDKFIPSHLTVNPSRQIGSLLDSTRKEYIVFEL